ncbi:unnamed protein product, partial [Mesorhabditis spiculigera]
MGLFRVLLLINFLFVLIDARRSCAKQYYHQKGDGDLLGDVAFGCICNATYCDDIEPLGALQAEYFAAYISTQSLNRMDRIDFYFTAFPNSSTIAKVDASKTYQTIYGFGGAITDAVGINLLSLSQPVRDTLMKQYYGPTGIDYRITRVPMASCDFSTREYSYSEVANDFELAHFNLTQEDYLYKIPFIKQAQDLVKQNGGDLKLFTTAWSAPGWMKKSGKMQGGGEMLGELSGPYYKTFANYYLRFFEAYHNLGIDFWGVTPINEPSAGLVPNYRWQAMFMSAEMERDYIRDTLGPVLRGSNLTKNIKIMAGDDQRTMFVSESVLQSWPDIILADAAAASFIDGFAVHWYDDWFIIESELAKSVAKHPEKFVLATEACTGYMPNEQNVLPGNWGRAEQYALDIIEDLRSGLVGWVDWNIVLDQTGGPNWVNNTVDSPIIANSTVDNFLKQPMFYALAHFSYFVKPGYQRVDLDLGTQEPGLDGVAFVSPDRKQRVLVLQNGTPLNITLSIQDTKRPTRFGNLLMPSHSIKTVVWNN